MGYILAGAALIVFAGLVWIGVVRPDFGLFPYVPWTILPGLGVFLLGFGLERVGAAPRYSALTTIGFLAALAGCILCAWMPGWFAPGWYRQRHDTHVTR